MEFNRVWALGRDTYLRVYPNPGIGLCLGARRLAVSWTGGVEWFHADPKLVWRRKWAFGDRRKR